MAACALTSLASATLSASWPRNFATNFEVSGLNNTKGGLPDGGDFVTRFWDTLSDPNNLVIPRCPTAGQLVDRVGRHRGPFIVLHNGIVVRKGTFYGEKFERIFTMNRGVHEPAEERLFAEVLEKMPAGAAMVELGAYWAYYSIWFGKKVRDARVTCVDAAAQNARTGRHNLAVNGVNASYELGMVGNKPGQLSLDKLMRKHGLDAIDLLHVDVQGSELGFLEEAAPLLRARKVRYLFLGTHSDELHHACRSLLLRTGFRIIASSDFTVETFSWDGMLVATLADNLEVEDIEVGTRQRTPLRKTAYPRLPAADRCEFFPRDASTEGTALVSAARALAKAAKAKGKAEKRVATHVQATP